MSAAEAALAEQSYVSPIDVLIGVGWLTPQAVERWRQGRVEDLERLAQADLDKLSEAIAILGRWAAGRDLRSCEAAYIARARDRRQLQFSRSGDADVEAAYRTHWVSAEASEAKRRRMEEKQNAVPDLVVVAALNDWTCTACSGSGELLIMEGPGPVCLMCADLDHLVLLPAGDAALTRRTRRRVPSLRSWCASVGPGVATSAWGSSSRKPPSTRPSRSVRPTRRPASGAASATSIDAPSRTSSSRPSSPPRSDDCFPDARLSGPRSSRGTPVPGALAGSNGAPPAVPSTPFPSPSPWSLPCATSTPPTTRC